jgi:hypothetical protein
MAIQAARTTALAATSARQAVTAYSRQAANMAVAASRMTAASAYRARQLPRTFHWSNRAFSDAMFGTQFLERAITYRGMTKLATPISILPGGAVINLAVLGFANLNLDSILLLNKTIVQLGNSTRFTTRRPSNQTEIAFKTYQLTAITAMVWDHMMHRNTSLEANLTASELTDLESFNMTRMAQIIDRIEVAEIVFMINELFANAGIDAYYMHFNRYNTMRSEYVFDRWKRYLECARELWTCSGKRVFFADGEARVFYRETDLLHGDVIIIDELAIQDGDLDNAGNIQYYNDENEPMVRQYRDGQDLIDRAAEVARYTSVSGSKTGNRDLFDHAAEVARYTSVSGHKTGNRDGSARIEAAEAVSIELQYLAMQIIEYEERQYEVDIAKEPYPSSPELLPWFGCKNGRSDGKEAANAATLCIRALQQILREQRLLYDVEVQTVRKEFSERAMVLTHILETDD